MARTGTLSIGSIAPKRAKSIGSELRVAHRVPYVCDPKVGLNCARVHAVVRQVEARRVSQHVRVDGESDTGPLSGSRDHLPHRRFRDGTAAFSDEQERRLRVSALELA